MRTHGLRRRLRFVVVLAAPIALAPACSSSSSSGDTDDPFKSNGANGSYLEKNASCERIARALNGRADALGCKLLNPPTCPAYVDKIVERARMSGRCTEGAIDIGTLDNCDRRLATIKQCGEFATKTCEIHFKEIGCATRDGGSGGSGGAGGTGGGPVGDDGGMGAGDAGGETARQSEG